MEEQWHLDKKVPLALMATIFFQSMAAVWWASSVTERQNYIEAAQKEAVEGTRRVWEEVNHVKREQSVMGEKMVGIDVGQKAIKEQLDKIDNKLDRLKK